MKQFKMSSTGISIVTAAQEVPTDIVGPFLKTSEHAEDNEV